MDDFSRIRPMLQHRDRPLLFPLRQQMLPDLRLGQMNNQGGGVRARYPVIRVPPPLRIPLRVAFVPAPARGEPRCVRMKVEDDVLSYSGSAGDPAGLYIATHTIDHFSYYFEIEILDVGDLGQISIGLVPDKFSMNTHPGMEPNSVGYLAENGKLYTNQMASHRGPPCGMGDRMGVGVKPQHDPAGGDRHTCRVFFTRNGHKVKSFDLAMHARQLFPAVGMQSEGEEAMLRMDAMWNPDDVTHMMVDCGEEDWVRLDDVRLNGTILEYAGRGRTIHDVGLAQAKLPLDTTNHYFEFEIVDPGEGCYVAIGLAKHNYPVRRHPGWNNGSIAYHADDGKLFHGSGMGVRFGPKCSMGDVMGCGIYFPPDYEGEAEVHSNDEEDQMKAEVEEDEEDNEDGQLDELFGDSDDGEDLFGEPRRHQPRDKGTRVSVFFTRNGKLIGHREVRVPQGGFYPTIGMLSCNEKVRVDLRPLTG